MSLMKEYIEKRMGANDLEKELLALIAKYNKHTGNFIFVYSTAFNKRVDEAMLLQDDYYTIFDMLKNKSQKNIDFLIETPGGSGEAAEEIARFLRKKFQRVSFVIAGEAKSAGTILALSGDEIKMTETGSLGPIDAQVKIGRSTVSAYDYLEWVNEKRNEAGKTGRLNPFDAMMVAQINPGELGHVVYALTFAKDLVGDWLAKYKFRDWSQTEAQKEPVTDEKKKSRAQEIASKLVNHGHWRSHGRSLKMDDLKEIGLKIVRLDDDPKIADIIYRIHTVCRLLFGGTNVFKVFATESNRILRMAATGAQVNQGIPVGQKKEELVCQDVNIKCPQCGKEHSLYLRFTDDKTLDDLMQKKFNRRPFPKDEKITCDCGYEIDLSGVRNEIEVKSGKKAIIG